MQGNMSSRLMLKYSYWQKRFNVDLSCLIIDKISAGIDIIRRPSLVHWTISL